MEETEHKTKKGEEKTEAEAKQSKRKRKEVFPFGNYRSYYGYRIGQDLDEDPRLKVFKKEWFEGKDCLDIGCNSGLITIHIAKKFCCRSIVGIDIDSDRIDDAYWHLKKVSRRDHAKETHAKASKLESAEGKNASEINATDILEEKDGNLSTVVSFRRENFVQSHLPQGKHYDTILCLSVTKWIHLNWGDDGLITVFSKIWRLLRPGGILILEPQPWKSYESNRRVSETIAKNYRSIDLRPSQFQEILLDKIGFKMVDDVTSSLNSKKGFNRPVLVFHK